MNDKYALVSVSDKTGIVEFTEWLVRMGRKIISTGGTAKVLTRAEIPVIEVSDYTDFPEMMDGRLKTLHPLVHGGILGREEDEPTMSLHGMVHIDVVVVNLYPFGQVIANPHCTKEKAIENIDIGGPTMLRAAAKNHGRVLVVSDPMDYDHIMEKYRFDSHHSSLTLRRSLAHKVFAHTAAYDATISAWFFRTA